MDWLGRARITNKKISYLCSSAVIRDSVGQRERREREGASTGESEGEKILDWWSWEEQLNKKIWGPYSSNTRTKKESKTNLSPFKLRVFLELYGPRHFSVQKFKFSTGFGPHK